MTPLSHIRDIWDIHQPSTFSLLPFPIFDIGSVEAPSATGEPHMSWQGFFTMVSFNYQLSGTALLYPLIKHGWKIPQLLRWSQLDISIVEVCTEVCDPKVAVVQQQVGRFDVLHNDDLEALERRQGLGYSTLLQSKWWFYFCFTKKIMAFKNSSVLMEAGPWKGNRHVHCS